MFLIDFSLYFLYVSVLFLFFGLSFFLCLIFSLTPHPHTPPTHTPPPSPTHTPPTPPGSDRLATLFSRVLQIFMAEFSWQPVMGAAQRRRQRRLRSWWRHEQQSIAAALATVMHHSSGKVHTANGVSRSQKPATRAEEEVEYEPHYALRGQKTPPPGERPAPLSEVAGPQRSDRTVRHSAGEAPLLVVPSLRGADGVDGTTVSFLLAENLKLQKKEEEEKERRRKRKEAEHEARMQELHRRVMADEQLNPAESYAWRKWAGHLPSEPRRKKKRKKKKTSSYCSTSTRLSM